MDPVTQGVVGALAAQAATSRTQIKRHYGKVAVIGALAGMAADLDILIRSETDPLLALEFHRHFTHSLIFIPLAAALLTAVLYPLQKKYWSLGVAEIWIWCLLGYATHGLLDACTSYGTQLLWPFSSHRVAWDIVSVIDPLFTLPLLGLTLLAIRRQSARWHLVACLWGALYLSLGLIQHHRATSLGEQVALQRGHSPLQLEVKPSFGNLSVWKVLYQDRGTYYVFAVKPGLTREHVWPGDKIPALDLSTDLPWLSTDSQQARDIERFRWFSGGYIALDPVIPNRISDIRYSMLPDQISPLWGIQLSPDADDQQHADYVPSRGNGADTLPQLWQMIQE